MDRYFSFVNESNWLGIGGSYLIHATNVLDLARQLTFRVTRHIGEEPIPVVDRTDDMASYTALGIASERSWCRCPNLHRYRQ